MLHDKHPELSSIPQHLSEPNYVAAGYASKDKDLSIVSTPAVPLWELLRRHHAPPVIEYLSLDIEGAEWTALKDFPFLEFRILCMTIERGGKFYDRLRAKLLGEGYRLARVADPDDFYVHESVNYQMSVVERIDTKVRSVWNMLYFREPMLTVRRTARWARCLLRGY